MILHLVELGHFLCVPPAFMVLVRYFLLHGEAVLDKVPVVTLQPCQNAIAGGSAVLFVFASSPAVVLVHHPNILLVEL